MTLEAMLGTVCASLSVAFIWPQVARVYRQHTVEGLSPAGTLQALAGSSLWAVYGAVRGATPVLVSSLVVGVAMTSIAAALVRHGQLATWHPLAVVATAVILGLVAASIAPAVAGIVATLIGATSIIPQTVHALRADDVSGISIAMYVLLIVNASCWLAYGLVVGDPIVSAPNLITIPCAGLIVATAWRARAAAVLEPATV